ncbi:hypothetical protein ACF1G5_25020 [Streptomyces coeruleorubidus]|uniref:hypothetical protein n=1 Tax=Streptomyces coeruleorubidus TaxID=116188 RepID=UPI0036FF44E6
MNLIAYFTTLGPPTQPDHTDQVAALYLMVVFPTPRPPQDGGADALLGDHAAQGGVRGQDVVLPDGIFQLCGAQAVGEWPNGLLIEEWQGRLDRFHRSLGSEVEVCGRGARHGTLTTDGSADSQVRGNVYSLNKMAGANPGRIRDGRPDEAAEAAAVHLDRTLEDYRREIQRRLFGRLSRHNVTMGPYRIAVRPHRTPVTRRRVASPGGEIARRRCWSEVSGWVARPSAEPTR